MRKRPLSFTIISCILALTALSLPVQSALVFGHNFAEIQQIFQKLTVLNWAVMIFCLTTAFALIRSSKAVIFLVPTLVALVGLNNIIVGAYNAHFDLLTTSLATGGFALTFVPLFKSSHRRLLLDAKLQWWRTAVRHRAQIDVQMTLLAGQRIQVKTFDISETGTFVATSGEALDLVPGQKLDLNFSLNDSEWLQCEAQVVRLGKACGTYPDGYGLEFVQLSPIQKDCLTGLITHTHS